MRAIVATTSARLALSHRDRRIIERALRKLGGARVDFAEAMHALREAVEEAIPDGRLFFLGMSDTGPIVGSLLSGVGIVERERGIQLVRAQRDGLELPIGWFAR